MTKEEELLFGLYRYINKASRYVGSKNESEFIKDEVSFDATCFAFYMIEYIGQEILKNENILLNNPDIDFKRIANYKNDFINEEGVDYVGLHNLILNEFPILQMKLLNRWKGSNNGK